jgi:predicted nucleic acid-binding protein
VTAATEVLLVVDASVMVGAFVRDAATPLAEAVVAGRAECAAPDLIVVEVAAAIAKRFRRRELALADAEAALGNLDSMPVVLHPHAPLLREATRLSLAHRHGLQDCLYLALARRLNCRLATADLPLAALADRLGTATWTSP